MIFLYILLGLLALVTLILITQVRIKLEFSGNLNLKIYFGFFRIPEKLFRKKDKKNRKKKTESKSETQKKTANKEKKTSKLMQNIKKKGYYNSLVEVLEFLKPVLSAIESFAAKIKVNPLIVKIKMTGSDAAELAIDYGRFCAVYYPLIKLVESKTNCKNIDSNVFVDYVSSNNEIYVKTELKIRLIYAVTNGFKIILEFIKFKDKFN